MNANYDPPLVLVADDEVQMAIMLSRIFERDGYRVEMTHDGVSAIEVANEIFPDLILLDVQMPRMNGFEVLRVLRDNPATASIPTIIVTAKARQPTDIAHGLDLGADDFVQKPFDPGELLARAKSKIKARKLEEALQRRTQQLAALLRVGEALSQHLAVNQIISLVPYLVLDLLPGSNSIVFYFDPETATSHCHAEERQRNPSDAVLEVNASDLFTIFQTYHSSQVWSPENSPLLAAFPNGIFVPLQHGDIALGTLMIGSQSTEQIYDLDQLRLIEEIGRQASVALRNAQLYEFQASYASRLEETVQAKTSELQSAHEMLIRAEKLASIGHLAASIAHEINNPLQPITVNLQHMREDLQDGVPVDMRDLQIIHESVERISRIVNQLLDFAGKRSTSDHQIQRIDVQQIIENVIDLTKKSFQQEEMQLVAHLGEPLHIYGNRDQLEQVFMNMILNAQAAMKKEGILQIETDKRDGEAEIRFVDNGSGISANVLSKIFDPFFSTKTNGTGLGLFVSYGIIQGHHGTIDVQTQENVGTTFIVRLPMATQ
jgi:signal transduction histidine kinase